MSITGIILELLEDVFGGGLERTDVEALEKSCGVIVARIYATGNTSLQAGRYITPYESDRMMQEAIASTDRCKW